MPRTSITFILATIAIAGFPPFAGFFSKDEILFSDLASTRGHWILWAVGSLAALCTSFYMFRLVFLTFFGKFRGTHEQEHHLHESPRSMTVPLIVLATLAVVGGWVGVPRFMSWVRLAFVQSVRCSPVRRHTRKVSMVPKSSSPASACCRAPATFSRIQRIFRLLK